MHNGSRHSERVTGSLCSHAPPPGQAFFQWLHSHSEIPTPPVENAREGYRLMAQHRGLHIIALGPSPT